MCRWIFYTGPELPLADLITRPTHSLIHQSYQAALREEPLNGDGFGVAWYPKDEAPAAFRSIQPAWNDLNLRDLARVTSSSTILAHVRAATPGLGGVSQANCHPFVSGNLTFMHNGVLGDFLAIKRAVMNRLSDTQFDRLRGTTDSEYIFALILDALDGDTDPSLEKMGEALVSTIAQLEALQKEAKTEVPNTFNFCLSNGRETAMTRYSRGREAESLFFHAGARYLCDGDVCRMLPTEDDQSGAVLVASEPLGDGGAWKLVEAQSLVLVRADRTVELRPI